jgi:hypothetical protein
MVRTAVGEKKLISYFQAFPYAGRLAAVGNLLVSYEIPWECALRKGRYAQVDDFVSLFLERGDNHGQRAFAGRARGYGALGYFRSAGVDART